MNKETYVMDSRRRLDWACRVDSSAARNFSLDWTFARGLMIPSSHLKSYNVYVIRSAQYILREIGDG